MLHEAVPDEVWINPIDASVRQLKSGDMVHVFNDRGVVEIPCKGDTAHPAGRGGNAARRVDPTGQQRCGRGWMY